MIPDIGSVRVPQVGQTINVTIDHEVVTVRVSRVRRHYPGAPIAPHHVGGGPGFVQKDQIRRLQLRLLAVPGSPRLGDIRAVPLAGMERLFFCASSPAPAETARPLTD